MMDIERFESLNSIGVNYWMMEDFNNASCVSLMRLKIFFKYN